jgi:hypothetical protein
MLCCYYQHAENLSLQYNNIKHRCEDIFEQSAFKELTLILYYTLTLHHFKDVEIESIMNFYTGEDLEL